MCLCLQPRNLFLIALHLLMSLLHFGKHLIDSFCVVEGLFVRQVRSHGLAHNICLWLYFNTYRSSSLNNTQTILSTETLPEFMHELSGRMRQAADFRSFATGLRRKSTLRCGKEPWLKGADCVPVGTKAAKLIRQVRHGLCPRHLFVEITSDS